MDIGPKGVGPAIMRLSKAVFDKVTRFFTIIARVLCTIGGNMTILFVAKTLNFSKTQPFPFS